MDHSPPLEPYVPRARARLVSLGRSLTWRALAAGVVVSIAVVAAGWWLLRAPAPPVELQLPRAGSSSPGGVPATSAPGRRLMVQVAGAVRRPGVYAVPAGARVTDVVDAAGGPTGEADVDAIALAVAVTDGQRVYVPKKGEPPPPVSAGGPEWVAGAPAGPLDINRADVGALDALPGIGPSLARAIVAYRDKHGRFRSIDDLLNVPGIGPAKLDAIRDLIVVSQ